MQVKIDIRKDQDQDQIIINNLPVIPSLGISIWSRNDEPCWYFHNEKHIDQCHLVNFAQKQIFDVFFVDVAPDYPAQAAAQWVE
jgi:hypothetical protein